MSVEEIEVSPAAKSDSGILLLREGGSLGIGDVNRFKILIDKEKLTTSGVEVIDDTVYLRIKNLESGFLRPVWMTGPYSIYVDVVPHNFDERKSFEGEKIQFLADLKPDETFKAVLNLNNNSKIGSTSQYCWTIDLVAQFTVVTNANLPYSLVIATTYDTCKRELKHHQNDSITDFNGFSYTKIDAEALWNLPPRFPQKPVHLVIITHGIFSSVGGDMLCLKDTIERAANEAPENDENNIIVRGFTGNVGGSYKGVRKLGFKLGKFVIETIDKLKKEYELTRISFIGHSLGGLVQSMAIHYISVERPDIFDEINGLIPTNFIAAASPFLGVIGDLPKYVSIALDIGALGQTGRDLTLQRTYFLPSRGIVNSHESHDRIKGKPLLELLPKEPALKIFQRFKRRTLYANAAFDGIVPLRTAAMLYLDWKGLSEVQNIRNKHDSNIHHNISNDSYNQSTGEIPEVAADKSSIIQWLLPQSVIKKEKYKPYLRTQTFNLSDSEGKESSNESFVDFKPPKKPNTIRAAASTIIAPLPTELYITNPDSRKDRIVHDKVYSPRELPDIHYKHGKFVKKIVYPNYSIHMKEERIARLWQDTMEWRKVLVELQPDSHNNIIVRRRFVNSFGWVAINHLADEHFGQV